jgi:hypothetical protein
MHFLRKMHRRWFSGRLALYSRGAIQDYFFPLVRSLYEDKLRNSEDFEIYTCGLNEFLRQNVLRHIASFYRILDVVERHTYLTIKDMRYLYATKISCYFILQQQSVYFTLMF